MIKTNVMFSAGFLHGCAKAAVWSHPSCDCQFVYLIVFCCCDSMFHKHFHNTTLKRGRNICRHNLFALHSAFIQMIQHCWFDTTETEIIWRLVHFRLRKIKGIGISLFGKPVYLRSARITKPNGSCHFIKRLTCGVISCPAQDFKLPVIFHDHKMGMSSGNHQAQKRRFQIRMFNIIRWNMPFYVVHTYKRNVFCKTDGFCLSHPYKQRAYKTRSVCDAYGI